MQSKAFVRRSVAWVGLLEVAGALGVVSPPIANAQEGDPGALVEVTLKGRVGVVLDEIPIGLRTAAALYYTTRPAQFWRDRAMLQVQHTSYQLTYRSFFYDEEEAKGNMALPPRSLWNVSLKDLIPLRVFTADGHDAVVMRYELKTTLLSDADTPGLAEPQLAEAGGFWDEEFTLPLDPEFMFQRTGYACIDEAGYPLRTADSENAPALFDQTCDVETPDEPACHQTEFPNESCLDALARRTGTLQTALHFERVPYHAQQAAEVRLANYTTEDVPDLQVVPEGLATNRIVYRYIEPDSCAVEEGCVTGSGWRRLLMYDASIENASPADLTVGEVNEDSPFVQHNVFEFSACHEHYHYSHYGDFSYGSLPGDKRAFCIESTDRYFNSEQTPFTHPYSCENQGIASGWGDTYMAGVECNWIDITGLNVPPGGTTQTLRFDLNPDDFICEGTPELDQNGVQAFTPTGEIGENGEPVDRPLCDFGENYDANNLAQRDVSVPRDGGFITAPCTRNQAGPLKDCGFVELAENLACSPGQHVNLRCRTGLLAPQQVLRVCENSAQLGGVTACMFREALATAIVGNLNTNVSFTCPAARSPSEPGGSFGYYGSSVLPTLPNAGVTCQRVN